MKRFLVILTAMLMVVGMTSVFAEETGVLSENFDDGACAIKSAANDSVLDTNIIDADEGDKAYGKVFKTLVSSTSDWYIDLGRTFTAADANIAKISFDIKAPMVANKNVLFYFGDSGQLDTKGYVVTNSSYRKKAMYFRANGNMGINVDSASGGSWYSSVSGTTQAYTTGQWYHIDITVDMHKQTATYLLDGEPWGTTTYGGGGAFQSFDFIGVRTEATNKTGYWYIDNIEVSDATVKIDKSVLFETDFEDANSAADAGIEFTIGGANNAVETGYGDDHGNVLRFTATQNTSSRFKVPVNAIDPANKTVSVSFDLYAQEADKHYCMIYLYDANGTAYKILVRNSNQAAGKMGYFKFLNTGAPWLPTDCIAKEAQTWVRVDGIFEFRDNQTVIKWYFDGEYAGVTYSFGLKSISYIRFSVNPTETEGLNKVYAIDNILMRQYENKQFTSEYALTGSGAGTTLTITPSATLSKDFSVDNCAFAVTDSVTGDAVTVASKAYTDGKVVLTLGGLTHNGVYRVSAPDFKDLYGQSMADFEFYANPQYDNNNNVIPAVNAVWLYDYDGNRLPAAGVTTEVNKIKMIFNTGMDSTSVKNGITFGGLTLNGTYDSKENSYTAEWGGYLAPDTTYALQISGAKSLSGKTMEPYAANLTTGSGCVAVKNVEVVTNTVESEEEVTDETTGEPTTRTVTTPTGRTAKVTLLNTTDSAADAVVAYGIYEDSMLAAKDFSQVLIPAGKEQEIELTIPYTESGLLKIFAWDKFGVLNPYSTSYMVNLGE